MLKPLKSYKNRNDIFVDLDLIENEMQALLDIFEDYWEFQYDEPELHCYMPKYGAHIRWNRIEKQYRNNNFIIWISTDKDWKTTSPSM